MLRLLPDVHRALAMEALYACNNISDTTNLRELGSELSTDAKGAQCQYS